jgi:hypothetical protein
VGGRRDINILFFSWSLALVSDQKPVEMKICALVLELVV